jgi:hypothetical protein
MAVEHDPADTYEVLEQSLSQLLGMAAYPVRM